MTKKFENWEKIGGKYKNLQGFECAVIFVREMKKGFDTIKFVSDVGIFEFPEDWVRKCEKIKSLKTSDITYFPNEAYLCQVIVPKKIKDNFLKPIDLSVEVELENGKMIKLKNLCIFQKLKERNANYRY
jgi:hypothetical protein